MNMYQVTIRALVLGCALLGIGASALAKQYHFDFAFDLVDDKKNGYIDPPEDLLKSVGDFRVKVTLDVGPDKTKNPFTKQHLADAATPGLQAIRRILVEQIATTNALIKIADTEQERRDYLTVLNKTYRALTTQAKLETEFKIRKKWEELCQSKKALRAWKFQVAYELTRDTFGLARGIAGVVGSSGAALAFEIVEITDRTVSIGRNIADLVRSEASVRKSLIGRAKEVRDKLSGTRGKVAWLKDKLAGAENRLESTLSLHQLKLTAIHGKAEALALTLEHTFRKLDALTVRAKKDKAAATALKSFNRGEMTKFRDKYVIATTKIGTAYKSGLELQKAYRDLLALAREVNPSSSKVAQAIALAKKAYDASQVIRDGIEGIPLAFTVAEAAADKAMEVAKKKFMKKSTRKLSTKKSTKKTR